MSRRLQVREVKLNGPALPHVWKFPVGVTVIVGDVGGGKTTLLNLIQFGLGGSPPLTEEVKKNADSVTLEVVLGGHHFSLTRSFKKKVSIQVVGSDGPQGSFTAKQSTSSKDWISDFLLEKLQIPSIKVPRSRSGKTHQVSSLSFLDVFAYCYMDQDQVDRSTVFSEDTFRNPKRMWTFELLHGLIDQEVARLEVEKELIAESRDVEAEKLETVEDFVRDNEIADSSVDIAARISEIDAREPELLRALQDLENQSRIDDPSISALEEKVERGLASVDAVQRSALDIENERRGLQEVANQIQRDLESLADGQEADSVLDEFPFIRCPRCDQAIKPQLSAPDECMVCHQPESATDDQSLETVRLALTRQLAETEALLAQAAPEHEHLQVRVRELTSRVNEVRSELKARYGDLLHPYFERKSTLEAELGSLRGERRSLSNQKSVAAVVESERTKLREADTEIVRIQESAEKQRDFLRDLAERRVDELSNTFDEILREFTLPWLETAEVDRATYLPRVNGRSLKELSSGGMKATTNVAYYLAIFATALYDPSVLTPSFLMLDSIRKDYGAGEKDLARADRIYGYLQTWQDLRNSTGAFQTDFQIIIVDNDLPSKFHDIFNVIPISPGQPLIQLAA